MNITDGGSTQHAKSWAVLKNKIELFGCTRSLPSTRKYFDFGTKYFIEGRKFHVERSNIVAASEQD